jgi:hypothetical protein
MACSRKPRQVRSSKKPGPKTVPVRRHKRSKPGNSRVPSSPLFQRGLMLAVMVVDPLLRQSI